MNATSRPAHPPMHVISSYSACTRSASCSCKPTLETRGGMQYYVHHGWNLNQSLRVFTAIVLISAATLLAVIS